ncbi:MAG: hypothetical protein PF445_09760 [Melioribacteraceae bacterium]|jgi:hypothetical protein|nr:hypothetical protein [Melioribacteraceae bacterium]
MNIFNRFLVVLVLINGSISYANPPVKFDSNLGNKVSITGDLEQLKYFFDALEKSKSEKIRIAHYGDSIIWGDIITDNLRNSFQKQYGGHGIGFVSVCTDDISARKTIGHEFSDDWVWASVFTKNREHFPIGIAGTVGKASESSSVTFKSRRNTPTADSFSEFSVFYSNASSNSSINYKIDNKTVKNQKLSGGNGLNVTKVIFDHEVKNIKIDMKDCDGAYFYGVTLDSGNGVYVDNFPFRGNSGVSMRDLDEKLLPEFDKNLNYKLFILQFGVNVASSGNVKYKWYERMMLRAIEKIKKTFPKSSILIVSPGDLGQKKGNKMVTHPEIKRFVSVQESIAIKGKVAFWNMFEAMGGENSVSGWVEASPPLAFKDYCHLTWDGGEVISNKIVDALNEAKSKIK